MIVMITDLTTLNNGFTYTISDFVTPLSLQSFNEIQYGNYALQNCSVRQLQILQLNMPLADLQVKVATLIDQLKEGYGCMQYDRRPIPHHECVSSYFS
jgi:hypothetical protein